MIACSAARGGIIHYHVDSVTFDKSGLLHVISCGRDMVDIERNVRDLQTWSQIFFPLTLTASVD